VDQRGVIHYRTGWWQPAAFRATVHLNEDTTFFVRHGDLLGRLAVIVALIVVAVAAGRYRRRSV
jgi:apolipoprotein N-acyltransferase